MKKILLSSVFLLFAGILFAQPKRAVAPAPAPGTPAPIVSTKELKRQLESNYKRKKYKNVLPIADTLLKRNSKDENAFIKKVSGEVMLRMDLPAIRDLKGWYKNKDTAATIIAILPYKFGFKAKGRSGDIYYKSAMAWAPKNGMPYILYGSEFADDHMPDEAVKYAKKGYDLLNASYKKNFVSTYASVLHMAGKKEEAYQLLEDELNNGNASADVMSAYFGFYLDDKEYQKGINKATELIAKDPQAAYYASRGTLYHASGNDDKACEDAVTLRDKYEEKDYWMKSFECAQVMADITPSLDRTYIYEVVFQGNTYDFRVSNPKVDMDNGVSFKYKLTGDVGFNGTVDISKEAIATAHAQMNHFQMETIDLTDKTSVWVSKEVFDQLKNNNESIIDGDVYMGQGAVTFTNVTDGSDPDERYFTVKVDDQDKYIKAIKILGKDGEEMWINDDPKNPLILKMKTDFSIELKQIL